MEQLREAQRRGVSGVERRAQIASEAEAKWRSDPEWRPPCKRGQGFYVCRDGRLPVTGPGLKDGETLTAMAACPHMGRTDCRLARSRERRILYAMRQAGVGEAYQGATLAEVHESIRPKVAAYLAQIESRVRRGYGLALFGAKGTGKTSVLAIIARAAIEGKIPTRLVHAHDYVGAALSRNPEHKQRAAAWKGSALLLIDDFGADVASDAAAAAWDGLWEHRNAHRLATCVTTNLAPDDMKEESAWARLYDRMRANCTGLALPGDTRRDEPPSLKLDMEEGEKNAGGL